MRVGVRIFLGRGVTTPTEIQKLLLRTFVVMFSPMWLVTGVYRVGKSGPATLNLQGNPYFGLGALGVPTAYISIFV